MDIEFAQKRYDQELERKDKLTDALAFPAGVLTVFVGANVAMAQSFSYTSPPLVIVFLVCIVATAIAFYGCAYRLWRAYHARRRGVSRGRFQHPPADAYNRCSGSEHREQRHAREMDAPKQSVVVRSLLLYITGRVLLRW